MKPVLKSSILAASMMLTSLTPLASQAAEVGPYLGVASGSSEDQILNESQSAYKLFGGVNITRGLGLEFSYVDLGEFANGALTQDGLAYEIVGYLPITRRVDLYGRAGLFSWEVANNFTSVTGTDPTFGVGANIQLSPDIALRGEWQTFQNVDGGDVDLYSAALSVHF